MTQNAFNWKGTPSALTHARPRHIPTSLTPRLYGSQKEVKPPAPRARRTDPTTSHKAAEQAVELAAGDRAKIVAALREFGAMGKDGIAKKTGATGHAVGKRMSELERMGLVVATGYVVPSNAGRGEREWRAA